MDETLGAEGLVGVGEPPPPPQFASAIPSPAASRNAFTRFIEEPLSFVW
jgi:hypothetical protein